MILIHQILLVLAAESRNILKLNVSTIKIRIRTLLLKLKKETKLGKLI